MAVIIESDIDTGQTARIQVFSQKETELKSTALDLIFLPNQQIKKFLIR
jgi:hypothetical protein